MVTTISPIAGNLGVKTDKSNLLSYAITTDGTMSTITEKVNGVVTGTKDATSGESLIAGLTQAQWDAVKFGKYDELKTIDISPKNTNLWEQGSVTVQVGTTISKTSSTINLRTINPVQVPKNTLFTVNVASEYKVDIIEIDSNNVIIQGSGWLDNGGTFTTSANASSVYILLKKIDNSTIITSDIAIANIMITYNVFPTNTLTVEMGTELWTYTFDKRPATDADIETAIKAAQDSQNTFLPAVKSQLASAIRGKGGTVNDTDTFEVMASVVDGIVLGKRTVSNTNTSSSTTMSFVNTGGSSISKYALTVTGLSFTPKTVIIFNSLGTPQTIVSTDGVAMSSGYYTISDINSNMYFRLTGNAYLSSGSFQLPVTAASNSYYWIAFE